MILVTGGAGYIGSHVLLQIAKNSNEKVVVVDNLSTGTPTALLHSEQLEQADLSDKTALSRIFSTYKPETVIHFAAFIDVGESVQNPIKYYQNNTTNTFNLLEQCIEHKVRNFIFSSTAAVYGITEAETVKETDPTVPLSPYGWSKLMSERAIQDTALSSDLRFVILRYFNVAGADPEGRIGQNSKKAHHLIKVCLETAKGVRQAVDIFGSDYPTPDGTGIRDYIHVVDLAQAHLDALSYLEQGGSSTIFNVGYGKGYSVREIVKAVETVTGKNVPTRDVARRDGDSAKVVANNEKITTNTAWKPAHNDILEIVKDAWQWELKS